MIAAVDDVLRHLLTTRVSALRPDPSTPANEQQVRIQPPDADWRKHVTSLGARKALNVYLVDVHENRDLRSTEPRRRRQGGLLLEDPPALRLDCHYLITAWSPADENADKTRDEHRVLSGVTQVLVGASPLVPRSVFYPDPLPSLFPAALADADLPTVLAPPDGFPKLAEFWGTMGGTQAWKPVLQLVVTVPVPRQAGMAGPEVTTRTARYRLGLDGDATGAEVLVQIGGRVLETTAGTSVRRPLVDAWVRLETTSGIALGTARSDGEGRFTFTGVTEGTYRFRCRARGYQEKVEDGIEVPSPAGTYDVIVP